MVEEKKTLLAVLAHPDDESFGMGGTLAYYARRSVAVYLVCATRGEAGLVDPQHLEGYESIADRRESELRCAAAELGLAGVYFLGYRDSGMPGSPDHDHPLALVAQPEEEVATRVSHYIRLVKPQVLITFDPIGGYRHPDHIAIHRATVRAFDLAAEVGFKDEFPPFRPAKLYFHLISKGFLKINVQLLRLFGRDPRRFGRNQDIDLLSLVEEGDFPVHARINYRHVRLRKDTASACHASQLGGGSLRSGPMRWLRYLFGASDTFMRAHPPPLPGMVEKDLFAGL